MVANPNLRHEAAEVKTLVAQSRAPTGTEAASDPYPVDVRIRNEGIVAAARHKQRPRLLAYNVDVHNHQRKANDERDNARNSGLVACRR
jgi:hypothetical protein